MATTTADFNALPAVFDFGLIAGDGLPFPVQLKYNGTAVNLTGCTLRLGGTGPGGVALTSRVITPTSASTGSFDAGLLPSETAAWVGGRAQYQVECVWPSGDTLFPAGQEKTLLEVRLSVRTEFV